MRELFVLLALLGAACAGGDDDAVVPPVRVDGGIDATPGPVDGRWSLTWLCTTGCDMNPGLYRFLEATATVLLYSDGGGGGSMRDTITRTEGDCVDTAGAWQGATLRHAYRLCLIDGGLTGTLTWETGDVLTTWDVRGVR